MFILVSSTFKFCYQNINNVIRYIGIKMAKICQITKKSSVRGNKRSHAMNATKRWFFPNLHFHRFWIEKEKRFIRLCVSAKGIRMINKNGIEFFLSKLNKI